MTNETEAVRAEPVAWRLRIGSSDMWSYTDSKEDADFYGKESGLSYVKEPLYLASEVARLTGEVSRLRDELRRIAELDPSEDSSEGFNEWGEAECFRIAQGHAKQALTQPEADHG